MYTIEFRPSNSTHWQNGGSAGNEANATQTGKSIRNRSNVAQVRIKDPRGNVVNML